MTSHELLRPVSLHTRRDDLTGEYVVAYDDGHNALLSIRRGSRQVAVLTEGSSGWRREPLAAATELGDLAMRARKASPVAAWAVPEGTLETTKHSAPTRWRVWALVPLFLLGVLAAFLFPQIALFVLLFVWPAGGAFIWYWTVGEHAWKVKGERIQIFEPIVDVDDEAADRIVAEVKAEYGELLSDIVVRIECAALFDPTVPATREFVARHVAWDRDRERLSPAERKAAAAHLRVAFDAAVTHARAAGLEHIPEPHRERATTAAKAFRLAADESAPVGERDSARTRGAELLGGIPLHFLPTAKEVRSIEGGRARLALPGRVEDLR